MKKRIWLSAPHMSGNEMKYIREAFDDNYIAPVGRNIDQLEEDLKRYLDIPHAVALNSGTAALHLALINLGVDQDDEVIVSDFTFCASVNPIVYQRAVPVFVDSEPATWNMDPELLEEAIRDRLQKGKKVKAVILVHLYGMPARIGEIQAITGKYNIPLIEDAAEALGSMYQDRRLGTIAEMGVLSFNGNKIITTSGGGALVSGVKKYARHALYLSTQARDDRPYYQHSAIGYNYRMSNVVAGIGRAQMEVLDERVRQRRTRFHHYRESLQDIEEIGFLEEPEACRSNRWLTTILIKPNGKAISSEDVRRNLEAQNIDSRPLWKPMHLQPIFSHYPAYLNGTSVFLFERGLCLPSGSNMTEDDTERVIREIKKTFHTA